MWGITKDGKKKCIRSKSRYEVYYNIRAYKFLTGTRASFFFFFGMCILLSLQMINKSENIVLVKLHRDIMLPTRIAEDARMKGYGESIR